MSVSPGTRLGRYEVRSLLGAGGMGEVYLAYDHDLERDVAIKVLRDGATESSDRVRRFIQEAKAASGLHHPNVAHVYEIGTHGDLRFIAMEVVEGETLRDRVARGPLPMDDTVAIGLQIAGALAAAHKAGIIHRDVKPENVIIGPDGFAKVLDFGLAKLREIRDDDAATLLKTTPGLTMGTLGYMAPEQISGGDVTASADVFSLGVVLYEMITGRRPFEGTTATEVVTSIVSKPPRPLHEIRPQTPPKLEAIVSKALAKNANDRFPNAGEMLEQLRQISREIAIPAVAKRPTKSMLAAIGAAVLVVLVATGIWSAVRAKRQRTAEESIKTAERLLAERKLPEAYDTAIAALAISPDNQRVRDVIARTSIPMVVESDPPGATVFLQRFKGPAQRANVGTTPLSIDHVPLEDHLVTLEKRGYSSTTRPVSLKPFYLRAGTSLPQSTPKLRVKLIEASKVPEGMVFVGGGEYRLAGWSKPSDRAVNLRDFFIDRYEVSNRDFEEFVRTGGYRRPEFWKHAFVDGGKTLSFEQAMARFHDTTGLPGPRSWSGGAPPAGRENHPVTDVTWYEASAFAEWKNKKLPSVYEWEKAARYPINVHLVGMTLPWGMISEGVDAAERANFLGKGTLPVDSMPFGISPWGAYNMAGNVAEWCSNPKAPGFAFRGGGWNDAVYAFGQTGGYPAFFSSGKLGFRCVKEIQPGAGDQGAFALIASDFVPTYQAVDDRAFTAIRKRYEYPKTPLNGRVIETVETRDWKREKIAYNVGGSTVTAFLYLPIGFHPPLQVIHFAPAADVDGGFRTLPASMESQFPPFIRGGRAVFSVLLEGYVGRPRPPDFEAPDSRSEERVEYIAERVTELRRGLDYLETRADLDHSRIAFMANSAGTYTGVILTALEKRYRSVLFTGTGITPSSLSDIPAANRINFAPRISAPKLMLQGRYDEDTPLKSEAEPLFRLMREPKRLQLYDGGHVPPTNVWIPTVTKWLDETLGPVRQ